MVDLSACQTSLDEVNGFQAQAADRWHPHFGRPLANQSSMRFPAAGALQHSGLECSRCVDGIGIPALSKSVSKLPRPVSGHLAF